MLVRRLTAGLTLACLAASAQEATSGFSVPAELTGSSLYSNSQSFSPTFRVAAYPTLQLGPHWFAYSALDARSSSLFGYQSGPAYHQAVRFDLLQAFLGYTHDIRKGSIVVKAGRLSSAFGSFALQYEDAKTLFPNPPPSYFATLPLRPDQLPCNVRELRSAQYQDDVHFGCGGSQTESYGMLPVTLYGLPGAEIDLSFGRFDSRFQVTNSSPVNPQSLLSSSQFVQWTAGAGYTFPSGLHLGASGFRGPYLDRVLGNVSAFPATGAGIDVQWARGWWSFDGEWQRFTFGLPSFRQSPAERVAYAEVKRIVTPRLYLAARATALGFASVVDGSGARIDHSAIPQQSYEIGIGFRPNNHQLLKASYRRLALSTAHNERDNILSIQLVTSVTVLTRAFR